MYISETAGSWFVVVNGARVASFRTQTEAQAELRKREDETEELEAIRAGFYR